MARLPRLRVVGLPFHVIVRGSNGQAIFRSEGDRLFFHRVLADACRRHGSAVHAYVFMTNHLHLLATGTTADSVSLTIQALGRRYVRYFNFVHGRSGPLWDGRFYSSVVDTDRYFLTCQRYIETNPVRAGICPRAIDFAWSSHRHYAAEVPDDLITRHSIHSLYGPAQYCRIFDEPVGAEDIAAIRDAVNHGWALGDEQFRERLRSCTGRRSARAKAGRPCREPELEKLGSDPD